MKRIALLFVFVVLLFSSAFFYFVLPAAAGQGGAELRGLISIFTPTPVERKAEVSAENKGVMLKFQQKIESFSFGKNGEKTVNVYYGLINGERGALFLLIEDNNPVRIIFYEPQDMEDFRLFRKKDEEEKKEWIVRDFKEYADIDLTK